MTEHDWKFEERGTDPRSSSGKPGEWHRCSGCRKRVFFPDGWSDFQKRLTVAMAWMDDVSEFSKEELADRTIPAGAPGTGHGFDKGYHGVLADDCDKARDLEAELVMAS
jgi:hypothetical protein